jgi:Tfp pilus assembly protein PilN
MKRRWKSRIWLLLGGAVLLLIVLVKLSGRQPVARISAVRAVRGNLDAAI